MAGLIFGCYSMVAHRHPCVTCIADGQGGGGPHACASPAAFARSCVSHRHLLRIRGCFVVRGGGTAILAEQVPPVAGLISDGGLFFG